MNLRTILKYCIYATALLPLVIFSQYISPFHFGKVVVFRSFVEIMFVLYVVFAWRNPSYRPRTNKLFWAFLSFALAFTLTSVTSINSYQSIWGTLERMGGLFSFWHYFVFYVVATSVLRTQEDWITLLKITVVAGALSALYGIGQRTTLSMFIGSGGRSRIFGTIGNPALFAGYELLNIFLALILASWSSKRQERQFWLISAVLMGLAVFLTAVRGSILGLSISLLLFAGLYFLRTHSQYAKRALLGLVGLGAIFILFSLSFRTTSFVQNSSYLRRITDFSTSSYTVQTRFWAWQAGLKGWSENPKYMLVGWGPENFNIPFSKYFNPKFFNGPGSETLFDRAHNMFVEILVTMGLVGILTYLWMFFVAFRYLWRLKDKPEQGIAPILLISMIVAYMIHNAFIFDTSANFIVFFSSLAFISFLADPQPAPANPQPLMSKHRAVLAVLSVVAILFVYWINILPSKANYSTTRGIVQGWGNDFNSAMTSYKKSIAYNTPGKYEFRNRMAQYLLDYSTENKSTPIFDEAVQLAIKEVQKNAEENPLDYLPELYLSRLNIILGKDDSKSPYNDEALRHANIALSYSPTFVRTYFEIGQAYLNKKDYPHAIEAFQKALDLNPNVGLSYWYLVAVQMESGNVEAGIKVANQALALGHTPGEQDYLRLANVYIKRNDYPNLVKVYEGLIKLTPSNAQYHASLAVGYAKIGNIDGAVIEAKTAAKLDPGFEGDARGFVQSLGRQW
ncbi:tetratricopeptide repeat protein [Candidatus Parcubacteria bacterium]|nr:tetratricopeptide repeat protein [Candidatus Parcubacteria bacterium]